MQTTRAIRSTAPAIRPWNTISTPVSRAASTWASPSCLRPCFKRSFAARRVTFLNQTPRFFSTAQSNPKVSSEVYSECLPICCPGCGAYSQTVEPDEPGYYGKQLKKIRKLAPLDQKAATKNGKDNVASERAGLSESQLDAQEEGASLHETAPIPKHNALLETPTGTTPVNPPAPVHVPAQVCDRCHDLLHHNKAMPVPSPSIPSIRKFIEESPHKNNRIFHILDAADFPMSLIPNVHRALNTVDPISQNRRARVQPYRAGQKLPTITFVITRSDLLGATKEQVDSKMNYMRLVLRRALGKEFGDVRLGNVHMISAHRGWWTKDVKDEILKHGGAVWVVGKANTGKSSFIEACYPKDSKNADDIDQLIRTRREEGNPASFHTKRLDAVSQNPDHLLSPAPQEGLYPVLPVVSSLPGTTAAPIRIPFGRGRGEVIDLPGLERSSLGDFVHEKYRHALTMTKRIKPARRVIKPGQSLLLGGGLIRITPLPLSPPPDGEVVIMAACFVPLESHVTRTEKAIEMQAQTRPYPASQTMLKAGAGKTMSSAGIFPLNWDVTTSHIPISIKKNLEDHSGPIPHIPYKVMSVDILIEGCGWVELTAQIRRAEKQPIGVLFGPQDPRVEVFSPNGAHIGSRAPMESWLFVRQKLAADRRRMSSRGRQNIGRTKRARHVAA